MEMEVEINIPILPWDVFEFVVKSSRFLELVSLIRACKQLFLRFNPLKESIVEKFFRDGDRWQFCTHTSDIEFSGCIQIVKGEHFQHSIIFKMDGKKGYSLHSIKELLDQIRKMCVCFPFNTKNGCANGSCGFKHICYHCLRGDHSASACPFSFSWTSFRVGALNLGLLKAKSIQYLHQFSTDSVDIKDLPWFTVEDILKKRGLDYPLESLYEIEDFALKQTVATKSPIPERRFLGSLIWPKSSLSFISDIIETFKFDIYMDKQMPENVQNRINELKHEKLEDPVILTSLEKVLEELLKSKEFDFLPDSHIVYREEECVSVEWPKKSIFCCFFSDLIEIDKIHTSEGKLFHDTREIKHNEIDSKFILQFEEIWFS
jgi:hypothetical protein